MNALDRVAVPLTLPVPPAHVHFTGIGGIGMSGLASILHEQGYVVTGSDAVASERTAALTAEGIPVGIGHDDVATAAAADVFVTTRAVGTANPEGCAAIAAGVRVVKRGELLAALANARRCVAVAGSHGKSTTTGMLVAALRALGADPSYAVGAVLHATGRNAALGTGDAMAVEADEFDNAFLWLAPDVAVITNVEFDHPDIFPDQESYDRAFGRFAANVRDGGTLVLASDDSGCRRLRDRSAARSAAHLVTFGERDGADWRLRAESGSWLVETPDGITPLSLAVPGRHNARNATAALATLAAMGYPAATAAPAIGSFTGIGRRFETKGEAAGVLVIDDYAHHPSEIRATLRAARERFPGRRLWAVFQPHTFSRTRALLGDFAASFGDADRIMILDIYASRETDSLGVSADDLLDRLPPSAVAGGQPPDAAARLANEVGAGDVVLTLGAGDVTSLGPILLRRLRDGAAT